MFIGSYLSTMRPSLLFPLLAVLFLLVTIGLTGRPRPLRRVGEALFIGALLGVGARSWMPLDGRALGFIAVETSSALLVLWGVRTSLAMKSRTRPVRLHDVTPTHIPPWDRIVARKVGLISAASRVSPLLLKELDQGAADSEASFIAWAESAGLGAEVPKLMAFIQGWASDVEVQRSAWSAPPSSRRLAPVESSLSAPEARA